MPHAWHSEQAWLQLMQRQAADVVREISGAERSWWDEREIERAEQGADGQAWNDGRLALSDDVVGWLIELRENNGPANASALDLRCWAYALSVVVHENVHLLGPLNGAYSEMRLDLEQPSSRFVEEGLTVLWTKEILPVFMTRIGVERNAPGIVQAIPDVGIGHHWEVYPSFMTGTRALLNEVASRTACQYRELLRQLAIETPARKFPILAQRIYTASGLEQQIPGVHRAHAIREIEGTMRRELNDHRDLLQMEATGAWDDVAEVGEARGVDAAWAASERTRALATEYSTRSGRARFAPIAQRRTKGLAPRTHEQADRRHDPSVKSGVSR
ncbi:MAG: hypothetical protein WAM30_08585 [Candidatus Dormiibacterota bacterium]